ncbi:hypothetical protein G6725_05885 [Polynucleobacter paneuropaeus]|jgi:hypothetical protein|nr:hypothetical protein [Polynucleobacter paneuropaeus]
MKDIHKTEERLLGLVKNSIFSVMGFALIAIPALLLYSLYIDVRLPKPISVSQIASKELNLDGLKNELISEQTNTNGLSKDSLIDTEFSKKIDLPYAEEALILFRCGEEFKKVTGAGTININGADTSKQVEYIRSELERISAPPSKGKEFVDSSVAYLCKVLKNPTIIELKKKGEINKVLIPAFNHYISVWNEAVLQDEQLMDEQAARIEKSKNFIFKLCVAAGSCFGLFIVLALYLMLIRLEDNLRSINTSIKQLYKHSD